MDPKKHIATKFLNFYLYSSLHIALCATALVAYTYLSYRVQIDVAYLLFVGASTILTYSLHRLVGIRRMGRFSEEGRFAIVKEYQSHIRFYAVLSAMACIILFWTFSLQTQVYLAAAAIVSLGYTLPIFGAGRRLRDFAFIKIFMIAGVWAFVTETAILVSDPEAVASSGAIAVAFGERFCYFVAITLPFDIRDLAVDKDSQVQTLPSLLGISTSMIISYALIGIAISITLLSRPVHQGIPLLLCYLVSALLIYLSTGRQADYWYSGLLDGTMLVPLAILLALSAL